MEYSAEEIVQIVNAVESVAWGFFFVGALSGAMALVSIAFFADDIRRACKAFKRYLTR